MGHTALGEVVLARRERARRDRSEAIGDGVKSHRVPSADGPGRAGLLLGLIGGIATVGVAGYLLGPAWRDWANCGKAGVGCPAHPIWGLGPELSLTFCLVGVAAGALLVAVGLLGYLRWIPRRLAGAVGIALGLAGLAAYGGFGVGVVAAVLGGVRFVRSERSGAGSPAEWTGLFPAGVPPAPKPTGRAVPGRPSVSEWEGAIADARPGPGGARDRAALPTADRLAEALKRSRLSSTQAGTESFPAPVVVLPPPPRGLRSSQSATRSSDDTAPSPSAPDDSSKLAPTPVRAPAAPIAVHTLPPPPARPPASSPELPRPKPRGPLHEFRPAMAANGPTPTPLTPPAAATAAVPSGPAVSPPLRAASTPAAPSRVPLAPEPPSRPPPPTAHVPKARTQAWRCPHCRLVNAPWSPRCTRCKAPAPTAG